MTTHRYIFGTTLCAIQVRLEPGTDGLQCVAEAVVVSDHPPTLRWVGGGSGPLEVKGATERGVVARMMAVLDQRFGPPRERLPDDEWLFSVPIFPPNDATSTVPVRLVWQDGRPDTLIAVPTREIRLQVAGLGGGGAHQPATFRLTGERDALFRWVYTQRDSGSNEDC